MTRWAQHYLNAHKLPDPELQVPATGTHAGPRPPEVLDSGHGQGWGCGGRGAGRGDALEGEQEVTRKRLASLGQRGRRAARRLPGGKCFPAFPSTKRTPTSLGWWPRPPPPSQPQCWPASPSPFSVTSHQTDCSCGRLLPLGVADPPAESGTRSLSQDPRS